MHCDTTTLRFRINVWNNRAGYYIGLFGYYIKHYFLFFLKKSKKKIVPARLFGTAEYGCNMTARAYQVGIFISIILKIFSPVKNKNSCPCFDFHQKKVFEFWLLDVILKSQNSKRWRLFLYFIGLNIFKMILIKMFTFILK